jgi:hypothetical protein
MKLIDLFEDDNEQYLFEMAILSKEETGLDKTIYASPKQHSSGPRIKVNFDNSLVFDKGYNFSVTISRDDPQVVAGDTEKNVIKKIGAAELQDIYDWVILNYDALIEYWENKSSTKHFLDKLQSI